MTTPTKCEFCDKRGLPLLLVRDAVAPAGAGAPLAPSLPIELAPTAAHYTKRLLRSGYVNVYDEARRRWEAYFVTADGYFFKLLHTPGVAPAVPSKPFNCPDEAHRAVASCITVSDPVNASKIWIGFSDVLWTDAVRKANDDPAHRRRHMVEIDVKAALKGRRASHTPIAQVAATVVEYAMAPKQAKAVFSKNPFNLAMRTGHAERLIRECEVLHPGQGLIVTVPDPAGIVQELAFLMKRNADLFINSRVEDQRKLTTNAVIDSLEQSIRNQAEQVEILAAQKLADDQAIDNPIGYWSVDSGRGKIGNLGELKSTELHRAAGSEWKKYSEKFDDHERKAWRELFNKSLAEYDKKYIAPLAFNHVAWMRSTELAAYFECNFDPTQPESGAVYVATVAHCLTATQDKRACSELYGSWLGGNAADTKNLILRAMVFNQDDVAKEIEKSVAQGIDLLQIPWDSIFGVYENSVGKLREGVQDAAAQLIVQISAPIARIFGKIMDGSSSFRAAVMATGLISGHPVVICDIVGTRKQFETHLIRQLQRITGRNVSEKQLRKAVDLELRRRQIHGVSLDGTTKRRFVITIDEEITKNIPRNLWRRQQVDRIAKSIKTIEEVEALNLERWRTVINQKVRFGIVAGILQVVSLSKLIADEETSLANDKADAVARRYAGIATLAATTSDVIGNALKGRATLGLRYGQGVSSFAGTLNILGKGLGMAAGLLVVGLDLFRAYSEFKEHSSGLVVVAYLGSALTSLGLTIALLAGATIPVLGMLVLLMIGIGILIEFIKDNPIQDWLERCSWGRLKEQRYPDLRTEQDQFQQAIK